MSQLLTMPQLSGGRERARAITEHLQGQMHGQTVQLDCRDLVAGTASFADEIIVQVLVEGGANLFEVLFAGDRFAGDLSAAAAARGVSERLRMS